VSEPIGLFLPAESLILAKWLDVEPVGPIEHQLTTASALKALGFDSAAAAVAAIVLRNFQGRLPNFRAVVDGEEIRGRSVPRQRDQRAILLAPQHVLSINWASSGPGFDWPAVYAATFVPPYAVHVITVSWDSTDMHGVTDLAIGTAALEEDLVEQSAEIIAGEWSREHRDGEQECWERVTRPGLISEARAQKMADSVWLEDEDDLDLE
jgi:hypothetical protein